MGMLVIVQKEQGKMGMRWTCVWCGKEKGNNAVCCSPDGDGHLFKRKASEMKVKYIVTYRNEGRPEKTPQFDTKEQAQETAEFLKFQGATSVKVKSA
jgi:hypothetical protein